jgi:hypothetical protein
VSTGDLPVTLLSREVTQMTATWLSGVLADLFAGFAGWLSIN